MAAAIFELFCFCLLLLPHSSTAQTYRNISLGDSLSTRDKNPQWTSPSGDFAFGFRPITGNGFILGIWFDKIPEKTMVWVAKRESPVMQTGSSVQLTINGQLVLKDHRGQEAWKVETFDGSVTSAAMLDTGNFVLLSSGSDFKWQSFENPTDTILPGQNLNQNQQLSSNLAETDYSIGRFDLVMQNNGNLVIHRVARPSIFAYPDYWSTNTAGSNYRSVVFNQSGYMYLWLPNGTVFNLTPVNRIPAPARDFYYRATLDYDGVFRQYVYPKTTQTDGSLNRSWTEAWSVPDDACKVGGDEIGSGACGFNGYCRLEMGKPNCLCPRGYSYLDENYKFKGCKQDFAVQDCKQYDAAQFTFHDMVNTDWPTSDFERQNPVSEADCRKACMDDCFCVVAIFRSGDCWKKKFPLSNGRESPEIGGKALIKVALGNSSSGPIPPSGRDDREKKDDESLIITVGTVLLSSSVFINFILLLAISLLFLVPRYRKTKTHEPDPGKLEMNLRAFTYKELEKATNWFKEELGRGAFGTVYRGILKTAASQVPVAVKRLDKVMQEGEKEFKAELRVIGQTHHKNLVKLLGFCDEGSHRLLVYEFMSNGSLARFLFGSSSSRPGWNQRSQIAFGIARGLMYLHEECSTQIIHCDIKPQNILLDGSYTAKIADFGLAKLLMNEQTRTSTAIRGTRGYVAPEWSRNLAVTVKVDVYSFGVMLLEIICCRKSVENDLEDPERRILTDWAYDCFREDRLDLLVEKHGEASNDRRKLARMVKVALWCIQEEPDLRPSMKKVTQMLEGAVEVATPPNPSSFISSIDIDATIMISQREDLVENRLTDN